jgi:hypothetical protein
MEPVEDLDLSSTSPIFIASSPVKLSPDVMTVNGPSGSPLFTIKPNGEFVPGPGLDEKAIGEFSKTFYKTMTVFGKSFADTLNEREMKIKELEQEIIKMKNQNGSFY